MTRRTYLPLVRELLASGSDARVNLGDCARRWGSAGAPVFESIADWPIEAEGEHLAHWLNDQLDELPEQSSPAAIGVRIAWSRWQQRVDGADFRLAVDDLELGEPFPSTILPRLVRTNCEAGDAAALLYAGTCAARAFERLDPRRVLAGSEWVTITVLVPPLELHSLGEFDIHGLECD